MANGQMKTGQRREDQLLQAKMEWKCCHQRIVEGGEESLMLSLTLCYFANLLTHEIAYEMRREKETGSNAERTMRCTKKGREAEDRG